MEGFNTFPLGQPVYRLPPDDQTAKALLDASTPQQINEGADGISTAPFNPSSMPLRLQQTDGLLHTPPYAWPQSGMQSQPYENYPSHSSVLMGSTGQGYQPNWPFAGNGPLLDTTAFAGPKTLQESQIPGPNPNAVTALQHASKRLHPLPLEPKFSRRRPQQNDARNGRIHKRSRLTESTPRKRLAESDRVQSGNASLRLTVDDAEDDGSVFGALYQFCKPRETSDGSIALSVNDLEEFFNNYRHSGLKAKQTEKRKRWQTAGSARPRFTRGTKSNSKNADENQNSDQEIAQYYRGYQKEFRLKENSQNGMYRCTLGCPWSHKKKGNWERHERSHYPPEVWLCRHQQCLNKDRKTRVSFRKDLIKRHYKDHHKETPSGLQIDQCRITVRNSLFPKRCAFDGCSKHFRTFDERLRHIEAHLRRCESIDQASVEKNYRPGDHEHRQTDDVEDDASIFGEYEDRDEEEVDEDENEDEEDVDEGESEEEDSDDSKNLRNRWKDEDDEQDRNPDSGASGGGSTNLGSAHLSAGAPFGTAKQTGDSGFYSDQGSSYNGYATNSCSIRNKPWTAPSALRLLLLPQLMAHGIAKTPIVLKKIQLQAALALETAGVKQAQAVQMLLRELTTMLRSLTKLSILREPTNSINTTVTDIVPLIARSMRRSQSTFRAYQSRSTLAQFGVAEPSVPQSPSESAPDPINETSLPSAAAPLDHPTKNIYQCLPNEDTSTIRHKMWRPSRLIHVGSVTRPILHLDVSDTLPYDVQYCSLSHCWDSGSGIQLTYANMTRYRSSIPCEDLPTIFKNAIMCSRERGLEYLWIDSLCIIQDSVEDWESEGARLSYIYARASYTIIVTTSLATIGVEGEQSLGSQVQRDDSGNDVAPSTRSQSVPALTTDTADSEEVDTLSLRTSLADRESLKAWDNWTYGDKPRRPSHQLWVRILLLPNY